MTEVEQEACETKEERFVRLATKRTEAALRKISLIGNLASPSYHYTDDQAKKIVSALRESVDDVEKRLSKQGTTKRSFIL